MKSHRKTSHKRRRKPAKRSFKTLWKQFYDRYCAL